MGQSDSTLDVGGSLDWRGALLVFQATWGWLWLALGILAGFAVGGAPFGTVQLLTVLPGSFIYDTMGPTIFTTDGYISHAPALTFTGVVALYLLPAVVALVSHRRPRPVAVESMGRRELSTLDAAQLERWPRSTIRLRVVVVLVVLGFCGFLFALLALLSFLRHAE